MRRCSVPGCYSNYTKPYVSVFTFPKDPELCKLWLKNIGRPALKVHENIGVCIKHFEKHTIIGIDSSTCSRKKLSIKYGSVPTLVEDVSSSSDTPKTEKKVRSVDKVARVQRKHSKSPSFAADGNTVDKSNKPEDEKDETSQNKVSPTTDRPIIAVIKAEDTISDKEMSPEKIDSNNCSKLEEPNPTTKSSPFKNLSNVAVCLKDEDRVLSPKELKGVKRSLSTGSNSSTGSSDVQKSVLLMKRRKIEKPAPVVLGRQNDCYCWVCHRENISLTCIGCPRAYHVRCAGEVSTNASDWVCPECQHNLAAESEDTRSSTLSEITIDKLGKLLKLSLNKMKLRAPIAFHQPVSLDHYPKYLHYVIHPMDFSLLEKNIKEHVYGSTEAFLADVKWIFHNSCVFNGTQHPLSTNAKNLVKSCDLDMQEIEVCPDCFVHSVLRNKYWFSEVCRKPHPLVWAKLKGFPYWPAKVVRIVDGNVDARFFGAHDRAWVPVSQCYHLSKEMPTTSKPKKKGNYEVALDELNVHVHFLIEKFGGFEYAPYRTNFNPEDKALMYHGIDLDKVNKEDITIDSNAQRELNLVNFGKGNRFANFSGPAEFEKCSAEETKLSENQIEAQSNDNTDKIEMSSPSFIIEQRISTDSSFSEKDVSTSETNSILLSKSIEESKSTNESMPTNESKPTSESKSTSQLTSTNLSTSTDEVKDKAQINNTDILLSASEKESDMVSDLNQSRKLELALERIKGYVSLNIDSEKENDNQNEENETKDKNEEIEKICSEDKEKIEKPKVLSPLFKDFPIIETHTNEEAVEDVNVALEATKKTDSFFLKLNETIESCKAKLGISEINDDLSSDESAIDDNASKSDEDEDEETTASEAEEEISEDDVDEMESEEMSEEEVENETNSESDKEDSELSDTDIESSNDISPKKIQKSDLLSTDNKNDAKEITFETMDVDCENSVKSLTNDSNEAIITNPDMEVPEVTIDASGAAEVTDENSLSSDDVKEYSESPTGKHVSAEKVSKNLISSQESVDESVYETQSNSSEISKDESSNVECVETINSNSSYMFNVNKNNVSPEDITSNLSPLKKISSPRGSIDNKSESIKSNIDANQDNFLNKEAVYSSPCKNQPEEEDDDDEILIYTPTKPKSPPVIVLDDDQENENSSISDTFAIKSPPYSTSMDSLSNEEQTNCKANSGDDPDSNARKIVLNNDISHEEIVKNDEVKDVNISSISNAKNDEKKRKFNSESSSDDEDIQVVTPVKRPTLTGAIRTFNKPNNNVPSLKPPTPTVESVKRNLVKESLNQTNKTPDLTEDSSKEAGSSQSQSSRSHQSSPSAIERLLKSPVDTSNLSDKDKEILYLKSKLNCVLTAYQIQSWKCSQEREELRHNMNLLVMEMRASLESDKKQAVEALSKKFEQEKHKSIEDAKRKQWCASCLMESRYACCWNTSYCSIDCQKRHFPEHRHSCSQLKSRSEALELKQKSATGLENNEKQKVFILNMKQTKLDSSQQISVNKSQIQVKPPLQIASSNNIPNNIQIVLAPVKSTTESAVTTSTASVSSLNSKEPPLDSAQIISQVRNKSCDLGTAIKILKKKNLETVVANKNIKEEKKQSDANLEDIYFPSPPKITFEGYDSATPDPNLVLENDEMNDDSILGPDDIELPNDATLEPDIVLSDTEDKDNEMVSIGFGIEMKAKFLNKCLVYGQTAQKLTRCLVDVIFPDIKLLGTCSAFGQMSNVTKLTRTALPSRKVHAIIDYVRKRFPDALRRDIVLQINMKCKEARVILNKRDNEQKEKKATVLQNENFLERRRRLNRERNARWRWRSKGRRLLAREKEDELIPTGSVTTKTSSNSITSISSPVTTSSSVSSSSHMGPSVVCVKSTNSNSNMFSFNVQNKSPAPNILQCNKRILIKPKPEVKTISQPLLKTVGKAAILQTTQRKRETVRNLLAANKMNLSMNSLSQDARKLVMAIESSKSPTPQPPSSSSSTTTNVRPIFIIGSQMNPVKSNSSTSVQPPAVPSSLQFNK